MTKQQWDALNALVTDRMKAATRAFVTPMVHEAMNEPTHIGSATYVELPKQFGGTTLITCEHMARYQDQKHFPFGNIDPVNLSGTTCSDREPLDVATIKLNDATWQHQKTKQTWWVGQGFHKNIPQCQTNYYSFMEFPERTHIMDMAICTR